MQGLCHASGCSTQIKWLQLSHKVLHCDESLLSSHLSHVTATGPNTTLTTWACSDPATEAEANYEGACPLCLCLYLCMSVFLSLIDHRLPADRSRR